MHCTVYSKTIPSTHYTVYARPSSHYTAYTKPSTHCKVYTRPSTHYTAYTRPSTHCRAYTKPSKNYTAYTRLSTHCRAYTKPTTNYTEYTKPSTHCTVFTSAQLCSSLWRVVLVVGPPWGLVVWTLCSRGQPHSPSSFRQAFCSLVCYLTNNMFWLASVVRLA